MKWIAPLLAYLAVGVGLFVFHSAWGALLGFHVAIIFSLLIAKPDIPLSIFFKSKNIKWIFLNILLCGSSGAALYFLWDIFGFANDLAEQVKALGLNTSNWPVFITHFALINPWIEEYFWRGYLGSKTKSLHTSDFLYAGYHALILVSKIQTGSIVFGLCVLVLAGWFWRQIAREDNGLLAPVLGHMAADFAILMAVYRMVL
jgi:membrane protease YdiL (CAAX protease family)